MHWMRGRSWRRGLLFAAWWGLVGCADPSDGGTSSAAGGTSSAEGGTSSATADGTATASSSAETSGTTGDIGDPLAPCEDPQPILQLDVDPPIASGFVTCADGRTVRDVGTTCDSPVAPGDCTLEPEVGSCTSDADCGVAGACVTMSGGPGQSCGCVTACVTDDDCGDGYACACAGVLGRSTCIPAVCRTNADCGDGLCRFVTHRTSCDGAPRLACTSAADTCVFDEACENYDEACYPGDGIFECVAEDCA